MKLSAMRRRARACIRRLRVFHPDAGMVLQYRNRFELVIAVVLSAQCTDAKVNRVLPLLLSRYPAAADLAGASLPDLERILRPLGLFRAKARNIKDLAGITGGRIPSSMAELTCLPGVGRKTANVVLTEGWGLAEGIAVDTHCRRLSQRLGFTESDDPVRIESDLTGLFQKSDWGNITHLFIAHGRKVCRARRPDCSACVLAKLCPSAYSFT